ncbi:MAG: Riboflavin synthase [Syntrophomonadaceae bacterium]|nr:Riboflavin synthase [Bacillota bacterium]
MFTGIIEEMGTVKSLSVRSESARIQIEARKVLADVRHGDSMAVNGVCLTVTAFSPQGFTADVMPETLRKTNLVELSPGQKVNLERALALGGRIGGHLVSGHVDGTGRIRDRRLEENAVVLWISASLEILRVIVPKGSIAVDGISLTVADVAHDAFSVSLVPHTAAQTTLASKGHGEIVNLENDLIGKYVDRLLTINQELAKKEINIDFLKANGFLQ